MLSINPIKYSWIPFITLIISRVALQATSSTGSKGSGGKDVDSAYAGDIFLILKHIPSFDVHCVDKGM